LTIGQITARQVSSREVHSFGNWVFAKLAVERLAKARHAPVRLALERSASLKSAPLRFVFRKSASARRARTNTAFRKSEPKSTRPHKFAPTKVRGFSRAPFNRESKAD